MSNHLRDLLIIACTGLAVVGLLLDGDYRSQRYGDYTRTILINEVNHHRLICGDSGYVLLVDTTYNKFCNIDETFRDVIYCNKSKYTVLPPSVHNFQQVNGAYSMIKSDTEGLSPDSAYWVPDNRHYYLSFQSDCNAIINVKTFETDRNYNTFIFYENLITNINQFIYSFV